jgi:hypothetical protein
MIPMACSYKPAHPYPLNDIEFQAELLTDRRGERSYGSRLNVKKLRAAALRERECAIASKRAARIAPRFRPASPSRGNRRSMVSLEEAQRSAAVAVYALDCSSFSTFCLPLFSRDSPAGSQESRLASRWGTLRVHPGASRTRPIVEWCLLAHQSQRIPRGQSSRRRSLKRAQPECGRALTSRSFALRAPSLAFGAGARVAPYGCHAVNWSG